MRVLSRGGGIAATNAYLVADEGTKKAVLFDAPDHTVGPLLSEAVKNGWDIIGLWLTHGHFDHTADHAEVTERFPKARVLIHKLDEPKLIAPHRQLFPLPFIIPPRQADGFVEDGEELEIGGIKVRVIHTPGHAPGHVGYYFPAHEVLIGGDLIIMGAVGRYDLPDSNRDDLNESIVKIMTLPAATRLLPGHGDPSTLGEEKESNQYVQQAIAEGRGG